MASASDLIRRALRRIGVLGVGETATADETNDALACMNGLLEKWSLESLMIYRRVDLVHQMTGAASYTVGPTGDIVTARPISIMSAFARLGDLDRGIEIADDDRFNAISIKSLSAGWPLILRYSATMPNGRIDIWPVPDTSYQLHLTVGMQFSAVEHSADELILPPGYERALLLSLAVDLCGEFQRPIPDGLAALAQDALATVQRANVEPAAACFDAALAPNRTGTSGLGGFLGGL